MSEQATQKKNQSKIEKVIYENSKAKQSTQVKSFVPEYYGGLSFSSKACNLAKQIRARKSKLSAEIKQKI